VKFSLILGLVGITLSLAGCTNKKDLDTAVDPWVTFDLGSDRLGSWPALGLIHLISELVGGEPGSIPVAFASEGKLVHLEVILLELREEYDIKPITMDAQGNWIHPRPPASPPGEIEPSWVIVGPEGVGLGDNRLTDHEFAKWLDFYAKTLQAIEERSALVIDAEPDVTCERLLTILTMLSEKSLDRILIQRQAEVEAATKAPPIPSHTDPDFD